MAFQIAVKVGDKGEMVLRGTPEGYVELGTMEPFKQKDGSYIQQFVGQHFFADMAAAFNRILAMRICSADATTLEALNASIRAIRAELRKELGVY